LSSYGIESWHRVIYKGVFLKFFLLTLILFPSLRILRIKKQVRLISLLICLMAFSACSGVSTSSTTSTPPPTPKISPSHVVTDFLEAIKRKDYGKTYEFISAGYAANLDIEAYKANMKQFYEKFSWSLLNYQILGVQILGDHALVVAELEVQFKTLNSAKETQKKTSVQYGLIVVDDRWKISLSDCISNCESREAFTGQGLKQ